MSKKQNDKTEKISSIGGQAVMEGIMMRGVSSMAIAVRDADGIIRCETSRFTPIKKRNIVYRIPILRGMLNFFEMFVMGMKTLLRSSEVYGEAEPSKFENWLSKKLKINLMSVITIFAAILGIGFSVFLFVLLPGLCTDLIVKLFQLVEIPALAKNFIEGGVRLGIFIVYILLVSLIKDIKRTFMYHGAEHKTITCYEKGMELTVENAKTCSKLHNRCGTTFMFFVMIISILVFSLTGWSGGKLERFLIRLVLLPVVAGLSYELLKLLAKSNSILLFPLKAPGLLMQKITTKEPTDEMLEVALVAFKKVMELDADKELKTEKFVVAEKLTSLRKRIREELQHNGIEEESEADWMLCEVLKVNRDELNIDKLITPKYIEEIEKILEMRKTGKPLDYVIGTTDFYGYKIKVDETVLIPRPETELLAEKVIKETVDEYKILDLCTGSGAIAIVLGNKTRAEIFASDVSLKAIELAKINAKINHAKINFIESDMFNNLADLKFDIIVSNPPYIKSQDLETIQKEVGFEPVLALDGGDDGLDFYRIIAQNAKKYLLDNGKIFMEIGYNQGEEVKDIFKDYNNVECFKDYDGNDRIIKVEI